MPRVNYLTRLTRAIAIAALTGCLSIPGSGKQTKSLAGDFEGFLQPYHLSLHLASKPDGSLGGTIDNQEGRMFGLAVSDLRMSGNSLSFSIPAVHGGWTGFVSADGNTLSGIYNQGGSLPLEFKRVAAGNQHDSAALAPTPPVPTPGPMPAQPTYSPTPPTPGVEEYQFGEYTNKTMANGQMGQMMQGPKMVGSIYTVSGKPEVSPVVPEPDASKVKKAFADWKASGKTGSTAPPPAPVSFEADGSAIVPLPDGTVVFFRPDSVEVNQPSGLAFVGQAPTKDIKFLLKGPGFGRELFGNRTNVFLDGKEIIFGAGFGGNRHTGEKQRLAYLKPMVDGPVTTAAGLADKDPKKPANALDYKADIVILEKRVNYTF